LTDTGLTAAAVLAQCHLWSVVSLRTMCGSRTGGWSLPGVMSD
jgi:hypothetical protein